MEDVRRAFPDSHPWPQRDLALVDELSLHHTVSPNRSWTREEEYRHIQAIYNSHRVPGRFGTGYTAPGLGYHTLIFPSGRIYQVGSLTDQRASVARQNHHIVGVALVGDFTSQAPTAEALESLHALQRALETELGRSLIRRPHRYYGGTVCPGDKLADLL